MLDGPLLEYLWNCYEKQFIQKVVYENFSGNHLLFTYTTSWNRVAGGRWVEALVTQLVAVEPLRDYSCGS